MRAVPAGDLTRMIGDYVTEKTGAVFETGMFTAFMVLSDDDDLMGAVLISNFRGTDCEISCVSETPTAWRPHVCRAVFQYIFDQLGCVRCTSVTTKANVKARAFLEHFGFQLEGKIRLGYDGLKDALIYGLLRSECRYLADEQEDLGLGEEIDTSGPGSPGPGSDGERAGGGEQGSCDYAGELEPDRPVHAAG